MCARYKLAGDWQDFPVLRPADFADAPDARPTNRMPIVRVVDGEWVVEMRRWGFLRVWPGPDGTPHKRQLFNAVGEELEQKRAFRKAFHDSRCLIPMSGWFEWPLVDGKKRKTEIALKGQAVFAAGGLFETSTDPDTGEPVDTYTLITAPPNRQLAAIHDRAPFILPRDDYAAWLEGDMASVQALITPYPKEDAFVTAAAEPARAEAPKPPRPRAKAKPEDPTLSLF